MSDQCSKNSRELAKMRRQLTDREFMVRARLAKRDLEYRDSPYAAPVTVEERGGRVIETRGQRCIASWVTHRGGV